MITVGKSFALRNRLTMLLIKQHTRSIVLIRKCVYSVLWTPRQSLGSFEMARSPWFGYYRARRAVMLNWRPYPDCHTLLSLMFGLTALVMFPTTHSRNVNSFDSGISHRTYFNT